MQDILFLDIETDRKGKITDYGALFDGKELHEKLIQKASRSKNWVCDIFPIVRLKNYN